MADVKNINTHPGDIAPAKSSVALDKRSVALDKSSVALDKSSVALDKIKILNHIKRNRRFYIVLLVFLMLANLTTTIFIILFSIGIYDCETNVSGLSPLQSCAREDNEKEGGCGHLAWYIQDGKKTCVK